MYRLINNSCDAVLAKLQQKNDIADYQDLQRLLREVNVSTDKDFQQKYRAYWRMNVARLGDVFYSRYFGLLESSKGIISPDIGVVVRALSIPSSSTKRESIQFSFASKLVHTLDPHAPVYDSLVASFYFFVPPSSDLAIDQRLDRLLEFYGFLRSEYERMIRVGLLDRAIRRFRARFQVEDSFCDERIVDLLLWGFVAVLRAGAQRKGQCLYA